MNVVPLLFWMKANCFAVSLPMNVVFFLLLCILVQTARPWVSVQLGEVNLDFFGQCNGGYNGLQETLINQGATLQNMAQELTEVQRKQELWEIPREMQRNMTEMQRELKEMKHSMKHMFRTKSFHLSEHVTIGF